MDWPVIEEKLESLRRRVVVKCPADVNALVADIDAQDILALNLTRAVQICVDIGAHLINPEQVGSDQKGVGIPVGLPVGMSNRLNNY